MKKSLILVPGLLGHGKYVEQQVAYFKKQGFRVFVYRLSKNDISPLAIAQNLSLLIQEKKLNKAVLWGISFGGLAVMEAAIFYSHQVEAIILGSTACYFLPHRLQRPLKVLKPVFKNIPKEKIYKFACRRHEFPRVKQEIKKLTPEQLENFFETHYQRIIASLEYYRKKNLHQISCPALIYSGKFDALVKPRKSRQLHRLIPNSELLLFDLEDHLPHDVEPDLINSYVQDFLGRLSFS
ncbi:alpha/beta fold hydrolase [Patescibacteria group bacterium]